MKDVKKILVLLVAIHPVKKSSFLKYPVDSSKILVQFFAHCQSLTETELFVSGPLMLQYFNSGS